MRIRSWRNVAFAVVVLLCLAQIGWWIYFQLDQANRLATAGELLQAGDPTAAVRILGAETAGELGRTAHRRRIMFVSEGVTLGLLVLAGVVVFYLAWIRERRLRRAQERFLAGVTHQLGTPLASVRLGLESMQAGSLPAAKLERYLAGMLGEVGRLERGLENLLGSARLASDERLHRRVGDLAADVRAAVAELETRADTARVRIAVDLEPAPVDRDPQAIRLVIQNLLDNALKFSPPGSVFRVELRRAGGRAVLTVTDHGCGIAAEDLPYVFERFFRGQHGSHRGGTGLGLHLALELTRRHGGSLTVASPGRDRGCVVEMRLPLAAAEGRR